jgi:hypothetical protein
MDYLTGNRKWLVRDFMVWGDTGSLDAAILASEMDPVSNRVIFMRESAGGNPQVVEFADLQDHRGNQVPATLHNPEVLIVPKNEITCFIVGAVGPSSFMMARSGELSTDAVVDLIIMEMN